MINIRLTPMTEADFEFSFRAKKEALGPCVAEKWGWDEEMQLQIHREHWSGRRFNFIVVDGIEVGTVWMSRERDHFRFGEFYILPDHQNRGIGTAVLESLLQEADAAQLPVRLEYLKWNRVGSLYRRQGFIQVSENDTHFFMERPPKES